jgi:hypothetical protein
MTRAALNGAHVLQRSFSLQDPVAEALGAAFSAAYQVNDARRHDLLGGTIVLQIHRLAHFVECCLT